MKILEGRKTYLMAGAMIVYAILGVVAGDIDANTAIQRIMEALTAMAIRNAI